MPIYLDYQASTPLAPSVKAAMMKALDVIGNPHSALHHHGRDAAYLVETARDSVAQLIGCEADSIIFTSGATEANNQAILKGVRLRPQRKKVLVSSIEHKCVLEAAYAMQDDGYSIERIPVDRHGHIDEAFFSDMLDEGVALVSIMSANNEIGTIQNLEPLVKKTHDVGALFHTDAAQQLTHNDIDAMNLGIDLMSLSAHKMFGPKGIGALYIAPHLIDKIEPLIHGGGQQDNRRSGTLSPMLCAGFGQATELLLSDGDSIRKKSSELRNGFLTALQALMGDSVELVGPGLTERHCSNLNLLLPKPASEILMKASAILSASDGSACSSSYSRVSHVLTAIGLSERDAQSCVRFSFGPGLQLGDLALAAKAIYEACQI